MNTAWRASQPGGSRSARTQDPVELVETSRPTLVVIITMLYIYTHIYIHIYCLYLCTYIYVYMYICLNDCQHDFEDRGAHVAVCELTNAKFLTHKSTYVYIIYIYMYTYAHTHVYLGTVLVWGLPHAPKCSMSCGLLNNQNTMRRARRA